MRRFNRFYTRTVGLLDETLTSSAFTLTEARVLFELGHRSEAVPQTAGERGFLADAFNLNVGPAASEIARELRLDPAYLTRILQEVRRCRPDRGAHRSCRSPPADTVADAGRRGSAGRAAGGGRQRHGAAGPAICPDGSARELADAMRKMTQVLGGSADERPAVALRPHAHRRHRLGDRAPVPPLCRGIWLERRV